VDFEDADAPRAAILVRDGLPHRWWPRSPRTERSASLTGERPQLETNVRCREPAVVPSRREELRSITYGHVSSHACSDSHVIGKLAPGPADVEVKQI
jgi:hypothetical protein